MEQQHKDIDLMEWESLFRHPNFEKVADVLSQRIEALQTSVNNRAKTCMGLNTAIESAGDLRVIAELSKILHLFDSLKHQILQHKGVK